MAFIDSALLNHTDQALMKPCEVLMEEYTFTAIVKPTEMPLKGYTVTNNHILESLAII